MAGRPLRRARRARQARINAGKRRLSLAEIHRRCRISTQHVRRNPLDPNEPVTLDKLIGDRMSYRRFSDIGQGQAEPEELMHEVYELLARGPYETATPAVWMQAAKSAKDKFLKARQKQEGRDRRTLHTLRGAKPSAGSGKTPVGGDSSSSHQALVIERDHLNKYEEDMEVADQRDSMEHALDFLYQLSPSHRRVMFLKYYTVLVEQGRKQSDKAKTALGILEERIAARKAAGRQPSPALQDRQVRLGHLYWDGCDLVKDVELGQLPDVPLPDEDSIGYSPAEIFRAYPWAREKLPDLSLQMGAYIKASFGMRPDFAAPDLPE